MLKAESKNMMVPGDDSVRGLIGRWIVKMNSTSRMQIVSAELEQSPVHPTSAQSLVWVWSAIGVRGVKIPRNEPAHSMGQLSNSRSDLSRRRLARISLPSWWKVFQQFLRPLIEPFLVFLRFLAGFKGMLGGTYPNELPCNRVIHTEDKRADVDR